jgi:hypothetical protein
MAERLVLCGGAKRAGTESILRLALDGRSQNVMLKLEDISKRLVQNVPDRLIDLIEIASYVYCADQATSRGGDAQVGMGSGWRLARLGERLCRTPEEWKAWSQNYAHESEATTLRACRGLELIIVINFSRRSRPCALSPPPIVRGSSAGLW